MNATTGPSRFETTTFGWGEELSLRAGFGVGTGELYAFSTAAPRDRRARGCYETETSILEHKLHNSPQPRRPPPPRRRGRDERRQRVVGVEAPAGRLLLR